MATHKLEDVGSLSTAVGWQQVYRGGLEADTLVEEAMPTLFLNSKGRRLGGGLCNELHGYLTCEERVRQ